MPKIWVDADACPVVIKDVLIKAARRTKVELTFVANRYIQTPPDSNIQCLQVSKGFDVADNEIVKRVQQDDLVITSDIPLASEVIDKKAFAINPRGEQYDASTIRSKLNMRDFMDTMRASGVHTGGPPPLGQKEKQKFANHLDQYLTKMI